MYGRTPHGGWLGWVASSLQGCSGNWTVGRRSPAISFPGCVSHRDRHFGPGGVNLFGGLVESAPSCNVPLTEAPHACCSFRANSFPRTRAHHKGAAISRAAFVTALLRAAGQGAGRNKRAPLIKIKRAKDTGWRRRNGGWHKAAASLEKQTAWKRKDELSFADGIAQGPRISRTVGHGVSTRVTTVRAISPLVLPPPQSPPPPATHTHARSHKGGEGCSGNADAHAMNNPLAPTCLFGGPSLSEALQGNGGPIRTTVVHTDPEPAFTGQWSRMSGRRGQQRSLRCIIWLDTALIALSARIQRSS